MKRFYSALMLFIAIGLCSWAQTYKSVAVNLTDGSKTEVNLTDDLTAMFDEENLVITGGDQDISVPRSQIQSFTFSEHGKSGVDNVGVDASTPTLVDGSMVFSALPEGSVVAVFAPNGTLLNKVTVSGSYTLDLSALPSGTVLVNVNGVAYKIAVKR